jgi:ABC-type molybdate transport system substrate-binding protein
MNTLLAAQGQSSTRSDTSSASSASDAWQDLSSQIENDAGADDSTATSSSYNSLAKMLQQQMRAMSFSAPPLSFSV